MPGAQLVGTPVLELGVEPFPLDPVAPEEPFGAPFDVPAVPFELLPAVAPGVPFGPVEPPGPVLPGYGDSIVPEQPAPSTAKMSIPLLRYIDHLFQVVRGDSKIFIS
jgi:hypothetical protein